MSIDMIERYRESFNNKDRFRQTISSNRLMHISVLGLGIVLASFFLLYPGQARADSVATTITNSSFNQPLDIAYDSANGMFYVLQVHNLNVPTIVVINATSNTIVHTIPTFGCGSGRIAYDSDNHDLYVTDTCGTSVGGGVRVIDGNEGSPTENTIIAGPIPIDASGIAYDSIHHNLYVTNGAFAGSVTVIDGNSGSATENQVLGSAISLGGSNAAGNPYGAVFDPANGYMYIMSSNGGVEMINTATRTLVSSSPILLANCPLAGTFDSSNGYVYVSPSCYSNNNSILEVQAINTATNTLAATIQGVNAPVFYDSSNLMVYAGNVTAGNNSVNALVKIDGNVSSPTQNTVISSPLLTPAPTAIAMNPGTGYLYLTNDLANSFSGSVTVIDPISTKITSKPSNPSKNTSPSFSFVATEAGSTFECQIDGGGYSACTNPTSYSALSDGPHSFQVRATDPEGHTDAIPPSYNWTIDTSGPTITSLSATYVQGKMVVNVVNGTAIKSASITFTFSATDNSGVTGFSCTLDSGSATPCTSPVTYAKLSNGVHTFQLKAFDGAGNSSTKIFRWTKNK